MCSSSQKPLLDFIQKNNNKLPKKTTVFFYITNPTDTPKLCFLWKTAHTQKKILLLVFTLHIRIVSLPLPTEYYVPPSKFAQRHGKIFCKKKTSMSRRWL